MLYIKLSGNITEKERVSELQEELIDISKISGWQYEIISENFQTLTFKAKGDPGPKPEIDETDENLILLNSADVFLEGISVTVDEYSDPLRITFDKDGKLASIVFYTTDRPKEISNKLIIKKYEFLYFPYIKIATTNYESHIKITRLLDYIKKKYIKDLEVVDNSFYWNNRDEEELKVKMWEAFRNDQIIS